MNHFIKYYGEHEISPVKQDVSNMALHLMRREKLYRQLGMAPICFEGKNVLEVGPGSGYNTLAFFSWGGKMQLVEPNKKGIQEMEMLFQEHKIPSDKYKIYGGTIEDFQADQLYDIVIAEGFLHAIENSKDIIKELMAIVKPGGIVVITCMDAMSFFVERMKRLVCHILTKKFPDYNDKVRVCTEFFEPQFKGVKAMSRSVEDWVRDDMLNPVFARPCFLSLGDGVESFSEEFEFLGSSQRMFTDYSWYKDICNEEKINIAQQFKQKRHNLLLTGVEEYILSTKQSEILFTHIQKISRCCEQYEASLKSEFIEQIVQLLMDMQETDQFMDDRFTQFRCEMVDILESIEDEKLEFEQYKTFYTAMGRTQQYLSMVKKIKY